MQQTEKYKFNLIETSDAFGPEKLNDNAQKLEDALSAQDTQILRAREENCLIKLGGPYEKPADGNIEVEFPDLDLSQYRGAIAFVNCIAISRSGVAFGGAGVDVANKGVHIVFFFNAGPRCAAVSLGAITSGSGYEIGSGIGVWGGNPRLSCGAGIGSVTLYLIKA